MMLPDSTTIGNDNSHSKRRRRSSSSSSDAKKQQQQLAHEHYNNDDDNNNIDIHSGDGDDDAEDDDDDDAVSSSSKYSRKVAYSVVKEQSTMETPTAITAHDTIAPAIQHFQLKHPPVSLLARDVLHWMKYFEPSNCYIWELVRSFHPLDFARLLHLMESVAPARKRETYELENHLAYSQRLCRLIESNGSKLSVEMKPPAPIRGDRNDCVFRLMPQPMVNINMCEWDNDHEYYSPLWLDGGLSDNSIPYSNFVETQAPRNNKTNASTAATAQQYDNIDMKTLMSRIRNGNCIDDDAVESTSKSKSTTNNQFGDYDSQPLGKMVEHNLATQVYRQVVSRIIFLLLPDTMHTDRNNSAFGSIVGTSCAEKFLSFHRKVCHQEIMDAIDPRDFRSMCLPPIRRTRFRRPHEIYGAHSKVPRDLHIQPLYHGFRVVVYSSPDETKVYNKDCELMVGMCYDLRTKIYCTYEAILMPTDRLGQDRSWHYWPYRSNFRLYVVDVFRYGQYIMTHAPFRERIEYAKSIVDGDRVCSVPQHLVNDWHNIELQHLQCADVYKPIVGVVLRDGDSVLFDRNNHLMQHQQQPQQQLPLTRPIEYRFNILYAFDLQTMELVSTATITDTSRMHMNLEMADYKTVCLAYSHCDSYIYLCQYDRHIHKFVHVGRIERMPCESVTLAYKSQKIFVVNCKSMPMGVLYLRVYYRRRDCRILGYDIKNTDGRFKNPLVNPFYKRHQNCYKYRPKKYK